MPVEVRVTTKVSDQAVTGFLAREAMAGVERALDRVVDQARLEIMIAGRYRSGEMWQGVAAERPSMNGNVISGRVVSRAAHSVFQHEGTANDGEGYIYPTRSKVLRFRSRSGFVVFAPKVRGVKGYPFLTLAMERLSPSDFT